MPAPTVKGFMPLSMTPRSGICDEQGVGAWPIWKRYDNVKSIIDQNIDEPYRDFLAMPYHEIDKLKAEELFYWYTPRSDTAFCRLDHSGDDHDYYLSLFQKTLEHYQKAVEALSIAGRTQEANFLQLSLKYAGESEENIYCGDDRVVVTVWGMRNKPSHSSKGSVVSTTIAPELEIHTVHFILGNLGTSKNTLTLKKSHGSKIFPHQVPKVEANEGYAFVSWDTEPIGAVVDKNISFHAQYKEIASSTSVPLKDDQTKDSTSSDILPQSENDNENVSDASAFENTQDKSRTMHHVRFLTPAHLIIREFDIEHGTHILPGNVPQLPFVDGSICPAWNGSPLSDIINEDHDYIALAPDKPEVPEYTVRFLTPDGKTILQLQAQQGSTLSPMSVPPLPVVDGIVCTAWDKEPTETTIIDNTDFTALRPSDVTDDISTFLPDDDMDTTDVSNTEHTVRFLDIYGNELSSLTVQHGEKLQDYQIPAVPSVDGMTHGVWDPNPTQEVINNDTDFTIHLPYHRHSSGLWRNSMPRGFWRWVLRIVLFLLFLLLVLYIVYLFNPCSR